jgi:ribonuclease HI
MPETPKHYLIYADGSCLGNPDGPGGWGVVILLPDGRRCEFNGHAKRTTNNRMEVAAAIAALRQTEPASTVLLRSDSQYLVNTMTKGWKRNANQDLWKALDLEATRRKVKFEWVRGHDGDPINHRADELAGMGANGQIVASDPELEQGAAGEAAAPVQSGEDQTIALLTPRLEDGEVIRRCAGCGAMFVADTRREEYCSRIACQLKARTEN